MPTSTGYNKLLGAIGAGRVQELHRRAAAVHAEAGNEPTVTGPSRTFDIIRKIVTTPANTANRIPAIYSTVAGLSAIKGTLYLPAEWNEARFSNLDNLRGKDSGTPSGITLKAADRIVNMVDIPATATESEDVVLLSDVIVMDDPVYGTQSKFKVLSIHPVPASRLIYIRVRYARED